MAMILREMTTRYGRSAGGYIWAVLEPVAFIAIFSIIFSQLTRDPALGRSFPLFFATGVLTFLFYRETADTTSGAFSFNRPLFTYPKVTILDAVLARFTLQIVTLSLVTVIVFSGIYAVEGLRPHIDLAPVLTALGLASLIGLAAGTLNCTLFVFFPTWQRVFNLFNRPLFIISGIFFTPEMLPPDIREVLLYNPLVHVIGLMRRGVYQTYDAEYVSWPLIIGLPLVVLTVGLILLRRYQGRMLEQ
jgi:capsular polysaccharide transport system permease protein